MQLSSLSTFDFFRCSVNERNNLQNTHNLSLMSLLKANPGRGFEAFRKTKPISTNFRNALFNFKANITNLTNFILLCTYCNLCMSNEIDDLSLIY